MKNLRFSGKKISKRETCEVNSSASVSAKSGLMVRLAVAELLKWPLSWMGTPFQVGNVVGSIEMLLIGWVMLRSQIFSKAAGYVGMVAGVVGLGMYVPKVGVFISIVSVVGMQVWYVMIAGTLLRLSRSATPQAIRPRGTERRMAARFGA